MLKYSGINDRNVKRRDRERHASEDRPEQQFVLPQLHAPDGLTEMLAIECMEQDEQGHGDKGSGSRSVDRFAIDRAVGDDVAILTHEAVVEDVENE